jgi:DNA-binding CsgD family transcriptional regulator
VTELVDKLLERIDTLIRIQALQAVTHLGTKTDKIMFLSEAGLQPKEIASIVGGQPTTVSQLIYQHKKKMAKKDE